MWVCVAGSLSCLSIAVYECVCPITWSVWSLFPGVLSSAQNKTFLALLLHDDDGDGGGDDNPFVSLRRLQRVPFTRNSLAGWANRIRLLVTLNPELGFYGLNRNRTAWHCPRSCVGLSLCVKSGSVGVFVCVWIVICGHNLRLNHYVSENVMAFLPWLNRLYRINHVICKEKILKVLIRI